jgi:spermidine synthase
LKKWNTVEQVLTPDGKTLSLVEHDGDYVIRVDSEELMSTRRHSSEERIAELACAHLRTVRCAQVLIGGLGMGFTLKAALAAVGPDAAVMVAEILPTVITWNQNPALPLASVALADPRVAIRQVDVAEVICASPGGFDSIILDVDNGPAALTVKGNSRLYEEKGLELARSALKAGGCLAFWSAASDPAFERLLARAGFAVEVYKSRAHGHSGPRHTLYVGRTVRTPGTHGFNRVSQLRNERG